jgi:arylsulfatase A-like enzyme
MKRALVCIAAAVCATSVFHRPARAGLQNHADALTIRSAPKRPDIILITIDALRADHLSAYGYPRLTSPGLDHFAEHALVFTNAIAQAPYTKASIASLMTGLYPSSHKAVTASVPFDETMTGRLTKTPPTTDTLPASVTTLAEALRSSGYRTIGLTSNPFLIAPFGFGQGFDEFQFFPGSDFADARTVVDAALAAVKHRGQAPIFAWLHLIEPHSPYEAPRWARGFFALRGPARPVPAGVPIPPGLLPGSPRDLRLYELGYDEDIAAADVGVDVFLREYARLRDVDNAVVAVTSDHGEQFLDHGGWEHSDTLYDELIRVPLLIQAPHVAPAVIRAQVELIDLYPTLLTFADAEVPADNSGRALPLVSRSEDEEEPAFSEIAGAQYAVRLNGWKLIVWSEGRQGLYDLRNDPREQHNLGLEQPARLSQLRAVLDRHIADSLARGSAIGPERAPIDPQVLERLRALGYVGR